MTYIDNVMCSHGRGCVQTLPVLLRELGVETFVFLEKSRATGAVRSVALSLD